MTDLKETKVNQAMMAIQGKRVQLVFQVPLERMGREDLLVHRDRKATKAQLVISKSL